MEPNEGSQEPGSHVATLNVPPRTLGAVEHPMIVKDIDQALKTFGPTDSFKSALSSTNPQVSIPLYFRPENPVVRPLASHNAATHNVVLKVTVPKRTGRKRKRGSDAPFEGPLQELGAGELSPGRAGEDIRSRARLDEPRTLRRRLLDNVGKYTTEPVGTIKNTHRYRGSADFQYSMGNSRFMKDFVGKALSGSVSKLRQFAFQPGVDKPPNVDIVPPPFFTHITMPFPYAYSQNPYVREVDPAASGTLSSDDEFGRMVNTTSKAPASGYFLRCDEFPVPMGPRSEPNMKDPQIAAIMRELHRAMEERPVWTRRSMMNRLSEAFATLPKRGTLVRYCMNYAGYQFKGGPWRDSLVRYGVDPRSDPKFRIYQTLIFKLHKTKVGSIGRSWKSVRRDEVAVASNFGRYWRGKGDDTLSKRSHEFDGEQLSTDGKVWQVCDITDPMLGRLFAEADVTVPCDVEGSGFYPAAVWAVAKGIMKRKMLAIRFGRILPDAAFRPALEACAEACAAGDSSVGVSVPLPDLNLNAEERAQLSGKRFKGNRRRRHRTSNKVRAGFNPPRIKIPGVKKAGQPGPASGTGLNHDERAPSAAAVAAGVHDDVPRSYAEREQTLPGEYEGDEGEDSGDQGETLDDLLESDEGESESESEEESEADGESDEGEVIEEDAEEDEEDEEGEEEEDGQEDEDDVVDDDEGDMDQIGRSGIEPDIADVEESEQDEDDDI